jgi:hypothetical protein
MIMRSGSIAVIAVLALAGQANAQAVSNAMSCTKAISQYEKYGRINTTTRSGATIPIYEGVPVSQRSSLMCRTTPIMVRTADNPSCVIAYKCLPRSFD